MKASDKLISLSSLLTGTALEHLMNIQISTGGGTIFVDESITAEMRSTDIECLIKDDVLDCELLTPGLIICELDAETIDASFVEEIMTIDLPN